MRELLVPIWCALPESLRLELLTAVQHGSPHRPDVSETFYAMAGEMLKRSWHNEMLEDSLQAATRFVPDSVKRIIN